MLVRTAFASPSRQYPTQVGPQPSSTFANKASSSCTYDSITRDDTDPDKPTTPDPQPKPPVNPEPLTPDPNEPVTPDPVTPDPVTPVPKPPATPGPVTPDPNKPTTPDPVTPNPRPPTAPDQNTQNLLLQIPILQAPFLLHTLSLGLHLSERQALLSRLWEQLPLLPASQTWPPLRARRSYLLLY